MVKNYLLGSVRPVYTIWGSWKGEGDNPKMMEDYEVYKQLYQVSRASAKKHLKGDWEELCFSAPILDARMFQIAQWYHIKELWHSEECNILAAGSDTLFVNDLDIWNKFEEFRLFNYTDPKNHADFPHYFNDDVRYYPSTMDPAIWEAGERAMIDWFDHAESDWACGQLIHNEMFWDQELDIKEAHKPEYAWQWFSNAANAAQWNGCQASDAFILHLHSSRNVRNVLSAMINTAKEMKLDIELPDTVTNSSLVKL